MANQHEKGGVITLDAAAWKCTIYNPVMHAIEKRFKNKDYLADAKHSTSFILRSLYQELPEIIQHVTDNDEPQTVFASAVMLISAAPKSVYKTLCLLIPTFVDQVVEANNLPDNTRTHMQRYFDSMKEDSRLSLMFIRDAVYISCPSTLEQLAKFNTRLETDDIRCHARLLTLEMCSQSLAISKMSTRGNLVSFPILGRFIASPAGTDMFRRADLISKTPPTEISLNSRRMQIIKFLSSVE